MLHEKWLKSGTVLNVAKLELIQLKKTDIALETQAKVEVMQLEKKELELRIKKLEQDTETQVIVREHVFVQVSFCACVSF